MSFWEEGEFLNNLTELQNNGVLEILSFFSPQKRGPLRNKKRGREHLYRVP